MWSNKMSTNMRAPYGCANDPGDAPSADELSDLEIAHDAAWRRAASGSGFEIKSVETTVTPIQTSPECDRKQVLVSLLYAVQVDGDLEESMAQSSGYLKEVVAKFR
jgi:hypothetical protein